MPTEFTHIFVSTALGKAWTTERMPARFWVLSAICSILPDVDVIGFYFGIKYSHVLGHRGFFHSLSFAFLIGVIVVVLAFPAIRRFSRKWWGMVAFFSLLTASHGLLDSMTDKGMGIGFFIPFDDTRYFLPWRPISASPMSIQKFFSSAGIEILSAEMLWIWLPTLLFSFLIVWYRRRKSRVVP